MQIGSVVWEELLDTYIHLLVSREILDKEALSIRVTLNTKPAWQVLINKLFYKLNILVYYPTEHTTASQNQLRMLKVGV